MTNPVPVTTSVKLGALTGAEFGFIDVMVGRAYWTFCTPLFVLPREFISPPYVAVMMCAPTESELVEKDVEPLTSDCANGASASTVNVSMPVGVMGPVDVTIAVNVTDCPRIDGFCDEVSVVVLLWKSPTKIGS